MANEELIALLQNLQGSGAGRVSNPGLLAQLPALVEEAAQTSKPAQPTTESGSNRIASTASNIASAALQGVSGITGLGGSNPYSGVGGQGVSGSVGLGSSSPFSALGGLGRLGGGLTLLPVVSSLLKLFGVGQKEELPPLEKFALPAPIRAEAGLSQSGDTFLIDRGVGDRIRPLQVPASTTSITDTQTTSRQSTTSSNITVNVQAMDSQSFLDRREDIARAVREAMLQSHSLNDVVSEL
jgi:hypothetical protein